jgi:hypothetical protein
MNVVVDPTDAAMLQRVSALLHDARIESVSEDDGLCMIVWRPGFEIGYLLSKGCFSRERRWMYPWVECELRIAPASVVVTATHDVDLDLDTFGFIGLAGSDEVRVGCQFREVVATVRPESRLSLRDTGRAVDRDAGMVVFSADPADVTFIRALLESG